MVAGIVADLKFEKERFAPIKVEKQEQAFALCLSED
jgi:hypothetical protein